MNNGVLYENFDTAYTYDQVTNLPVSGAVNGAFTKVLGVINNNATYSAVKAFLDTDHSGAVSNAELSNYSFSEVDPAHPGTYYGYRTILTGSASSTPKLKTFGVYLQDQWQIGHWNLTLGVRGDDYKFLADTGEQLWKSSLTDNLAPRLGVSWDINGDGRTKLFGFWGRYVDPMKLDMVSFGGSLTSSVRNEDIRINNTWVTENVRGGVAVRDALLVDSLKNPKTDELRLGFSRDFGKYTLDVAGTYRHDFDIVEDWDPGTYASADALESEARGTMGIGGTVGQYSGNGSASAAYNSSTRLDANGLAIINAWRALVLPVGFWAGGGKTGAQNLEAYGNGEVNFFLGNLPGGYRTFRSVDVTLTRKLENKWGGFASATFVSATGNSLSSGNADFQGDLARFDPRLPFTNGSLEGSPDWLAKSNLYYKWDNGLMVSMTYNINSGYHYSDSFVSSNRALQATPKVTSATTSIFYQQLLGKNRTPVVRQMDLRVQYSANFAKKMKGEIYLDIFNAFNTQQPTDIAEGTNVRPGFGPGQAYAYQAPLSMRIGARLKF
ncbi:MAG: TonB-dependent receptor [Holophagaceae bacterium]|nr:TonB-dependent receptor [Holophagaceae bacterium]